MRLGYRMRIGSREISSVWNDPWVRHLPNVQVQYMIMQGLQDLKVYDLLLEPGRWNEEFIHQILSPIEALIVCGQLLLGRKSTIFQFSPFELRTLYGQIFL